MAVAGPDGQTAARDARDRSLGPQHAVLVLGRFQLFLVAGATVACAVVIASAGSDRVR